MAGIRQVTVFQTSDGNYHTILAAAQEHEKKIILSEIFMKTKDPLVQGLTQDQSQAVLRVLAREINSIVAELELAKLI